MNHCAFNLTHSVFRVKSDEKDENLKTGTVSCVKQIHASVLFSLCSYPTAIVWPQLEQIVTFKMKPNQVFDKYMTSTHGAPCSLAAIRFITFSGSLSRFCR